jgi:catechol 2,3-dioxygenase-like lactoylglutathione lyase family enzyme
VALFGISLASPGSDGARLDVSVGVHHLDLVVSSLERSVAFYRELLDPLGYARIGDIVGERGEPVVYVSGGGSSIGVREARVGGDYDRYRIGVHDIALEASSRDAIDERYKWAQERGVAIESPPKEYDYMPGYYAFFFYDPDASSWRSCTLLSSRDPPASCVTSRWPCALERPAQRESR